MEDNPFMPPVPESTPEKPADEDEEKKEKKSQSKPEKANTVKPEKPKDRPDHHWLKLAERENEKTADQPVAEAVAAETEPVSEAEAPSDDVGEAEMPVVAEGVVEM